MENLTFRLTDFEGPLDLLLYLISKDKKKIAEVEIVSLIDQYLEIVNGPQGASLESTSEFIEMAARLIYMKSVFLLPRSDEQDQLREELTGQLVEYAACKRMAQKLGEMAQGLFVAVRRPLEVEQDLTYRIRHDPAELERAYGNLMGGAKRRERPRRSGLSRWSPRPLCRLPAGWSMCCAIWSRDGCTISPRFSGAAPTAARISAPFWRCSSCSRRAGSV